MVDHDARELPVSLAEAQAYLRIETGDEEALLAGLLRSATQYCEAFTGQCLIAREVRERVRLSGAWQRLSATPVRSIDSLAAIAADGSETALEAGVYAVDIDCNGDGWVRLTSGPERLILVRYVAGLATDANGVPEPLRQGIVRLAAHLFNCRDGDGGEPPAAVTALWRPYRRMRIA